MPEIRPAFEISAWPAIVEQSTVVVHLRLDVEPQSKARPRLGKGGNVYTPDRTRDYETAIGWHLKAAIGGGPWPNRESRFGLRAVFYRSNRQRIDCDNLLKAISDAATGVVWRDDVQVIEVMARVFVACDTPAIELLIYRLPDPTPRMKCLVCATPIVAYRSVPRKFCSMKCKAAAGRASFPCPQCGVTWEGRRSDRDFRGIARRFCSKKCAALYREASRRPAGVLWKNRCERCLGKVAKRQYRLCRPCHIERPIRSQRKAALGETPGVEAVIAWSEVNEIRRTA